MHTDINLTSYFTFENITGAYKHPGDITMITNTFGVKLIARDVLDGRISPYVGGGFGIGYYQLNSGQGSFSTTAMRYAVGVDLNMSDAAAIRLDFGGMRVGQGLVTGQGQNNAHVAVGLVFSLGGN
jgi:hemolysin activation/secretion protein